MSTGNNKLDRPYHKGKLQIILRDLNNYTPDELARSLLRLVCVADPIVMTEDEFVQARLEAIGDVVNAKPILKLDDQH